MDKVYEYRPHCSTCTCFGDAPTHVKIWPVDGDESEAVTYKLGTRYHDSSGWKARCIREDGLVARVCYCPPEAHTRGRYKTGGEYLKFERRHG